MSGYRTARMEFLIDPTGRPVGLKEPDGDEIFFPTYSADQSVLLKADGTALAGQGAGYVLPVATVNTLGGVKAGANVTIAADGTLSAAAGEPGSGSGFGVDATDVGFDLVLCAGQSNMAGRGTFDALFDMADGRVWQWGCDSAQTAYYRKIFSGADPLHMAEGIATGKTGPATSFARAYAASIPTNRRVLLIPLAEGGTGLTAGATNPKWLPGNPGGTRYENAITQTNLAITAAKAIYPNSRVVGTIWVQGENDALAGVTQSVYATTLNALIAGFRARITGAADSWFIIGGMVPEQIASFPTTYNPIVAAHQQVATETDKCAYIPGPTGFAATSDTIHYKSEGSRILGARMALAADAAKRYVGVPATPAPADTVAPSLSSPTGTATGTTTASGSVTTDEANGTLYYWATPNATETVAAIKSNGGAQAVASTGSKAVAVTELTANALYYLHFAQTDAAGNDSTRVTSASFTTSAAADTTAPTLSSPTATKTGSTTATGSVVTNEASGTLYRYASTNAVESAGTVKAATLTSAVTATGTQSVSFTGLSASTVYYPHFVHRDASGNDSTVASGASFTTDALSAEPANTYTFTNDTVGAAPAGMTVTNGALEVVDTGVAGWAGKYLRFSGPATADVYRASLDNIPAAADRTVTWRRGVSQTAKARDCIQLRVGAGSAAGVVGARHGYAFQVSGSTNQVRIYKFSNSAATIIGGSFTLNDVANRWFRASAIGTTLTFEYSDDGVNWTVAVTTTDGVFTTGGVDYINGFGTTNTPNTAYIDDISWS